MKATGALAERADLLGVACWRSAVGRQEAPRRRSSSPVYGRPEESMDENRESAASSPGVRVSESRSW
jgi:hypothetical protein